MAEIINLRRARKARDRTAAHTAAQANRARHGRTGDQRRADEAEARRLTRAIDAARLEPPGREPTGKDR